MTHISLADAVDQMFDSLEESEPTLLDKGDTDLVYDEPDGPLKKYSDNGEAGAGMGAMLSNYDVELAETIDALNEMLSICENSWNDVLFSFSESSGPDKFSREMSQKLYDKMHLKDKDIDFDQFFQGMNVELEHRNVTHGDPIQTAKIAIAHIQEVPDYYTKLKKYVE